MNKQELLEAIKKAANRKAISLDLTGNQLRQLPPEIGQLTSLQTLDLTGNQLRQLPPEIGQLTSLQTLDLSENELRQLPPEIGQLTSLQTLDLIGNELRQLPPEIGQLTSLQTLNLTVNQLSQLPPEIGQLTSIQTLNLTVNQLRQFPPEIGQLTSLQTLDLTVNQLRQFPPEIGQLTSLQTLNLSRNQLSQLPPEIGQLTSLQTLDLTGNQLSQFPPEIGQLTSLQTLNLTGNQLRQFPPEIGQLTSLQTLNLSRNQLSQLPPEIGQLTSLQTLDLTGNQLSQLPPEIGQLTSLQTLDLTGNQLSQLPPEIGQLTSLQTLDLTGNQLSQLPPEIKKYFDNPTDAAKEIPRYYRQILEQEIDHIYEAKLLIVGEGGAGKTTLANKIKDRGYKLVSTEQSTKGIDIIRWKFPFQDDKDFIVNIWDFGGQAIYHATHQFFLTKRSLYILVADSRKEDTDFFYWLNVVDLLSKTSPILIVKNEKQDRKREIDERQLRSEFLNLKEVLSSNLANNRGLSDIKQAIEHYIQTLPHVGTELPKTWVKVRQALETNPRNHITLEEYLDLCQENGFTRYKDKLQLSGYLHDLGVCLHFQDDDLLRKTIILKPTWGTDAVYHVLDNLQVIQNLGRFNRDDLAAIWHEEQYVTMRPELLRLMMNFKLCYEIPRSPHNYIAPQLLSPKSPDYPWDETDNLLLRYSYDFMPKGILTRFIVEMHQWIENPDRVWKTGVILSKDKARAEVIELYHRKEIHIRVCGDRRRDILTTVRYELDKIHATYERLKYNTLVPCNCKTCKGSQNPHFYVYDKLIEKITNNKKTVECDNKPYLNVEISGLIDDIGKSKRFSLDAPEMRDRNLEQEIQSILSETMPNRNITINADVVSYTEKNLGEIIGKKYASDRDLVESLTAIVQILQELSPISPTKNEAEIEVILEAEIQNIKQRDPNRWQILKRQLLNPKRWLAGGRAAAIAIVDHYVEDSALGNGVIAFLDKVSEEE